ncbi:hypothetical protein EYF80_012914 [Liparis tanakae]|uniref:Uncharacterized protein n=1 Tax=Liparis tanakae TaxID=230148 RepID=A0A4Z2IGG9_9TELE|nr:hypothetical protein EYF80_012914 [Liparis tanakae]
MSMLSSSPTYGSSRICRPKTASDVLAGEHPPKMGTCAISSRRYSWEIIRHSDFRIPCTLAHVCSICVYDSAMLAVMQTKRYEVEVKSVQEL